MGLISTTIDCPQDQPSRPDPSRNRIVRRNKFTKSEKVPVRRN